MSADKKQSEKSAFPYNPTPDVDPFFGQPEDCYDMVNKYGTYNIQPTAESENVFPLISHALPTQWKDIALGKDDVDRME